MRWLSIKPFSTRDLLRAEHRLQAYRQGNRWPLLALVLLLAIAGLLWQQQQERQRHAQQVAALAKAGEQLQAELEQNRLVMLEAQAAQAQLLRRIETMSAEAKTLKTELAFFRRQKSAR